MATNSVTEDDIFDNIKQSILQEMRAYLCKYLVPDRYYAYLRTKYIITEDDQCVIDHEITKTKKASKFLDILLCKGGEAYEALVTAIRRDKSQNFLVEKLHKEFEKRKNAYYEMVHSTRPKELLIANFSLPKPPPPMQHEENIETVTEVFSSIPGKEHKNATRNNREPTESGYESLSNKSNGHKNSSKDMSKNRSSLIPVTVADPSVRTLQVAVADEIITVTGPPCNPHMGPDHGQNRLHGYHQPTADKSQKEHANYMRNKLHARAGSLDTEVKDRVEKVIEKTTSLNLGSESSIRYDKPETNGGQGIKEQTCDDSKETTPMREKQNTENEQTVHDKQRPSSLPTTIKDVCDDEDEAQR